MEVMIPKNTTIPYQVSKQFPTTKNNQTEFVVTVLEGEEEKAQGNCMLAQCTIENLRPNSAGKEQVDVTYNVDADGCFKVHVHNRSSGRA